MNLPENDSLFQQVHRHPLFSGTTDEEFAALMDACALKNYEKSEKVLYSNSPRHGLLLILKGVAEVFVAGSDERQQEVLEVLEVGDMIGFSSLADFLGEQPEHAVIHNVEVRTVEPSVCLHIPYSVMERRWHEDTVQDFMLRQAATRLRDIYHSLAEQVQLANKWGESEPFIRRIQDVMTEPAVTVQEQALVQEVARKIMDEGTSSVIVLNDENKLSGIITEKDLVGRVIASGQSKTQKAYEVMTKNPYTISRHAYYYEAMSMFLMNKIKHLPVEEAGRPLGMVTLSDLLQKKNRGTLEVIQTIEESTITSIGNVKEAIHDILSTLLRDGVPTIHMLEMITKLYDRLVQHCLQLTIDSFEKEGLGAPPVPFTWYMMGSSGRGEQFMPTDQDHFLVYQDTEKEEGAKVADYFKRFTEALVETLEKAGYRRCPGDMMASSPNWCGSLSMWRDRLRRWGLRATNDHILLGHNFLSFRYVAGDEALHNQFQHLVKDHLERSRIYLYRMAEHEKEIPVPVLDHPIRALFRVKRDKVDLKKHALFPFHHCLQLLGAQQGIVGRLPLQFVKELSKADVISEEMNEELFDAYEVILSIRVKQGLERSKDNREGPTSEVHVRHLRTREKEQLIHAIKTIRTLQQQTLASFGMF